jgi:hypothetical protein
MAYQEMGYADASAFCKHAAEMSIDPSMLSRFMAKHQEAANKMLEAHNQVRPMQMSLLDRIKGLVSSEPHVPGVIQNLLDERVPEGVREYVQPGEAPGQLRIEAFNSNGMPEHRSANVNIPQGPTQNLDQFKSEYRKDMMPGYAIGGGLLGGALGAGTGYFLGDTDEEKKDKALQYGGIGAGAGVLGGGLLGYLHGGALGEAQSKGHAFLQEARKAFGN